MEMSKVLRCEISNCAYNSSDKCHAMAITIGDSVNPKCDTLCMSESKCEDMSSLAGVGACKTALCMFNKGLECSASEISVGYSENEVDCLTFRSR